MTRFLTAASALALATLSSPAAAVTTVLDFTGNICGVAGTSACGNGTEIGQSYGDSAIVNVSYRSITTATNTTFESYLKHWGTGYGNLTDVVWGGADAANYRAEIVFTPLAGYEVSLLSFRGGCYLNRASCQTFPYSVAAVGGATLAAGTISPPSGGNTLVTLNTAYNTNGIALVWGPDAYDGGLTDITFDVRAIVPGAIPEPATWAMMIGGVGLVGGAMRRRRTAGQLSMALA